MNALSVAEVAKLMGKSERWVRYLCTAGKLEAIKIGKKTWMITGDGDVYTAKAKEDDKIE